jgi:hypothetical protein
MNVLVIAEDPIKDQFMLRPIIEAMFEYLQRPAKVRVHPDRLGGIGEALKVQRIAEIVASQRYNVDLFIEVVDRDCNVTGHPQATSDRQLALQGIENQIAASYPGEVLLGQAAWEEIEVWILAGVEWKACFPQWRWTDIRSHRDPKDAFFIPYARIRGLENSAAEGRDVLGREAARQYAKRLRSFCKEDLRALEDRVAANI